MRILAVMFVALAACGPITPERAADRCEERARGAQGPTFGGTVGMNSNSGGFASARIGITSDALRGLDPLELYDSCVLRLTGQPPIRPVRLR